MANLKPCPFCGSSARIVASAGASAYRVQCVNIAVCGCRTELCDEECEAIEQWNNRYRSWNLLMEWLDEIYPADIFDGSSGDIGPQILVKLREINELRRIDDESTTV